MEKPRNGGEWTEARFHGFVTSALRAGSRRWPPKYGCLADAFVGKFVSERTGRVGKQYKCASCGDNFPSSQVQVDHIEPIVNPELGFTTWDNYINRLFCEKDNLQVLCKECHKEKTLKERAQAQECKSSTA